MGTHYATAMRHASGRSLIVRFAQIALALSAAACIGSGEGKEYRDEDRSALAPAIRAQWLHGKRSDESGPQSGRAANTTAEDAFRFRSTLAASATRTAGSFVSADARPEYSVATLVAAWQPELTMAGVCIAPLVGLGHGAVEVDDGAARLRGSGVGFVAGNRLSYRGLGPIEPYARYESLVGLEYGVRRFEVGLEWHATDVVGVQLAYLRQTSVADDIDDLFGSDPIDSLRVETEGVHLGLAFRF